MAGSFGYSWSCQASAKRGGKQRGRCVRNQKSVYCTFGMTGYLKAWACGTIGWHRHRNSKDELPKIVQWFGRSTTVVCDQSETRSHSILTQNPRRIPLPLMGKVKEELHRMETLGVISRLEEPTDWCAGMVVVPKKSDYV